MGKGDDVGVFFEQIGEEMVHLAAVFVDCGPFWAASGITAEEKLDVPIVVGSGDKMELL